METACLVVADVDSRGRGRRRRFACHGPRWHAGNPWDQLEVGDCVFHGIEAYAGYECTDIERTHWNGLIVGLRFWF
jgi:hypothetical protein